MTLCHTVCIYINSQHPNHNTQTAEATQLLYERKCGTDCGITIWIFIFPWNISCPIQWFLTVLITFFEQISLLNSLSMIKLQSMQFNAGLNSKLKFCKISLFCYKINWKWLLKRDENKRIHSNTSNLSTYSGIH